MHVVVKLRMELTVALSNFALIHRMLPSYFASHCYTRCDALGAWDCLNPTPREGDVHEQASAYVKAKYCAYML
jgi:hypothetical protein